MKSGGEISGAAMAKRLASCNHILRNRALRLLSTWLPAAAASVSDADMAKIWKGLFYCVWHSDKLVNQVALAGRLSSLVETLDPPSSLRYVDAFLATIHREWSGIDQLRLDKFYLLIRKFLNRSFALLKKHDRDRALLDRFIAVLEGRSLLAKSADGVSFFVAEVFLEELAEFLPIAPETASFLVEMFVRVLERSNDRVLVYKVRVNVFEKLIVCGVRFLGGETDELGKVAVVLGLSERFLKSASDPETVQGNRKVLFALRDGFLKLEKDFEKSGLKIAFENEVAENGMSDERPAKKRKKAKNSLHGIEKESDLAKVKNSLHGSDGKKKKKKQLLAFAIETDGNSVATTGGEEKTNTKKKDKKKKNVVNDAPNGDVMNNGPYGDATNNGPYGDATNNGEALDFNETVISNLHKQFEKVAAEAGMSPPATPVNAATTKKRKRAKSADGKANGVSALERSGGEKIVKKVSFSMKNNLVWKPQNPLPPQSLRLPPSATPRGSALKKGVPPGPVKESPATIRKIKAKGSSVKKARKTLKNISPAIMNLHKLQGFSV